MNLPLASLKGTLLVSPLHPIPGPGLCLKEELVILERDHLVSSLWEGQLCHVRLK